MNAPFDDKTFAFAKFAVGQPAPRLEDPILVQGKGSFCDDLNRAGQLHACMVRSAHAHGFIRRIDVAPARAMPGVRAIYTAADLADYAPAVICALPLKGRDGAAIRHRERRALASDRVRFVGDPVACVVAETAVEAQDAAEAVILEIDALAPVTTCAAALAADAPQLYDDAPGNVALDFHSGDAAATAAAFAKAAHVARLTLVSQRIVINALEPRSALAEFCEETGRFTFHTQSQGVFGMREHVARVLGVARDEVRVVTGQVGGSFGMKGAFFPEYLCILHAARALGAPVKWTDRRGDSFTSDHHGRDGEIEASLALDAQGRFLALRLVGVGNMGAYLTPFGPLVSAFNVAKNIASVYRTPLIEADIRCVFTNTVPVTAYRGAGRPEANYYLERLIETAAREMGLDSLAMRRLNHIQPADMPFTTAAQTIYDSGDFTAVLDRTLECADWNGFCARKAASAARGLMRGRGIGQYLEVTAPPSREMAGIAFGADDIVTVTTGTLDVGQGHWTAFAQVLSQHLGVPFERIRLVQGDSDQVRQGGGTGGSKSLMASGAAIVEAAAKIVAHGKLLASHVLEASPADIVFEAGRFSIAGTDRAIDIMALARRLREGAAPPDGIAPTLDLTHVHEASPSAFPNGCHAAEVEIDPETGVVEVVKYTMVNDFGTVINPLLVAGQCHGGIVQGIGQALMEAARFDEAGQLLTGSFMDYAMPRADRLPDFTFESLPSPARTNPLGAKGCGEAGCAGSLPSVMNAIVDALSPLGVTHIDMPATPLRVWETIQRARA